MTFPIFDSHCHLDADAFDADRSEVMQRAAAAGVVAAVLPATDLASCERIVSLLEQAPPFEMYGAVGVHPHEATTMTEQVAERVERLSHVPRVVAIGETGLDYHYSFSPPEVQRTALRTHVEIAVRRGLPLVLHCRDAETDLLETLESLHASTVGGVVHCFTGTWETAKRFLDLGFHLGFTGIITFRNADALRDVVRQVPLTRILLETDSPYLAPIPHRGKRNEPAYISKVAETVGALHAISAAEAAAVAMENTRRCFRLPEGRAAETTT